jgi:hypothetical protein
MNTQERIKFPKFVHFWFYFTFRVLPQKSFLKVVLLKLYDFEKFPPPKKLAPASLLPFLFSPEEIKLPKS